MFRCVLSFLGLIGGVVWASENPFSRITFDFNKNEAFVYGKYGNSGESATGLQAESLARSEGVQLLNQYLVEKCQSKSEKLDFKAIPPQKAYTAVSAGSELFPNGILLIKLKYALRDIVMSSYAKNKLSQEVPFAFKIPPEYFSGEYLFCGYLPLKIKEKWFFLLPSKKVKEAQEWVNLQKCGQGLCVEPNKEDLVSQTFTESYQNIFWATP